MNKLLALLNCVNLIFINILINFTLLCQIDDDFMAHYQLSYGFNSSDNSAVNINITNTLKTNTDGAQSIENKSESTLDASGVKSEPEKRKLQQPSEPSKLINFFLIFTLS